MELASSTCCHPFVYMHMMLVHNRSLGAEYLPCCLEEWQVQQYNSKLDPWCAPDCPAHIVWNVALQSILNTSSVK
jgi:hypothetical protein